MSVKAILQTKGASVLSITSDASVAEAVTMLSKHRIGALPVINDGAVLGIFSERDVVYGLAKEGAAALERPVSEVMTTPAMTVDSDCAVLGALSLMTRRRIRHLPVVDAEGLVGFISIGDLVKHRIEKIESEAEAMRSYIQSA
jgi:CBS domain-containing protein